MSETIRYPSPEPGAADVRFLPKMTEHQEPGGVNGHHAGRRDVLPPPDLPVELLGAVNIRDGDDDDLELHVAFRDARFAGCVVNTDRFSAHGCLLSCVMSLSPL